jgi:hypothetical protein
MAWYGAANRRSISGMEAPKSRYYLNSPASQLRGRPVANARTNAARTTAVDRKHLPRGGPQAMVPNQLDALHRRVAAIDCPSEVV